MAESPSAAEAAFYAAFERSDIKRMMAVWANSADICCIHPLGDILLGTERIRASWMDIFAAPVPRKIEVERVRLIQHGDLAIHFVRETLILPSNFPRVLPIIAANTYRLYDGGWRMVVHHASPLQPSVPVDPPRPSFSPTRH